MTIGEPNQFEPNSPTPKEVSLKLREIVDINRYYNDAGKRIFLEIENLYSQSDAECFDSFACAQLLNILAKYCKEIMPKRLYSVAKDILEKYLSVLAQSDFRGIANAILALAKLSCEDKEAIELILDEAVKKIEGAKPQEIANMLWATAVLGFIDHNIVAIGVGRARKMLTGGLFNDVGIMQLYHFNLDTELLPEIDSVFKELETAGKFGTDALVSRGEQEIINEFQTVLTGRSDFDVKTSFRTDGFECDIALMYDGERKKVNIEIDGVSHRVERSTDQFRDRILNKLGWDAVVRIRHDDIMGRGTDSIADLIKKRLQEAGIPI